MYDPFVPENETSDRLSNRLLSARKTPFFQQRLTCLEWHSAESHKRPRNDFIPLVVPIHGHGHAQSNLRHSANQDPKSNKSSAPDSQIIIGSNNNNNNNGQSQKSNQAVHNHVTPLTSSQAQPTENVRIVEKPVVFESTTIMGTPPLVDDRVRHLVQFILQHVDEGNVEIEAKLGTLIGKDQSVRVINLVPVICETPIRPDSNNDVRFESDVGEELFQKINERLNVRVEETNNANPNQSKTNNGKVTYLRTQELDVYYPNRIRQTRKRSASNVASNGQQSKYNQIVGTQRKTRLGDLNVLCPFNICDIRYSASREQDCELPSGADPEMQRDKYRLSYNYEYVRVDITTVEMITRGRQVKRSHEVEVEVDSSSVNLYEEVKKYNQGDESSKLFDIATSLVQTVRVLLEI